MSKRSKTELVEYLKTFSLRDNNNLSLLSGGKTTVIEHLLLYNCRIPVYINEFWTAKQRQASSIHEISYRACFKPQLPNFFINLLTEEGDLVYDPFSGRGTTVIEAGLMGRRVIANDINPLSMIMSLPRLTIPSPDELKKRLAEIPMEENLRAEIELSMFFYRRTEAEIVSFKKYLDGRQDNGAEDRLDRWIRMIATNRLTGHSPGFFSVYTLPPNQAVSPESQIRINVKRKQEPVYRDTKHIILKKSKSLLRNLTAGQINNLQKAAGEALFLTRDARNTPEISTSSVQLTVTSPPFLDVVQYSRDNWLRCWFNSIDTKKVETLITMSKTLEEWSSVMGDVFKELFRITKNGGWVAFEVGEIKSGRIQLEEHVVPLGLKAGFVCEGVVINLQEFTKTSNIWGINNNNSGTNTNRIVLFQKTY
ncbi:MAG: site-specific DNA-methyltransferase [Dethiobacter sp.]|jgi:tRNA G10  N-methylase Trm11|nr:MAG: site-specific DNA-methyltransferase [Dethiobacter sp.]